MIAIFNLLFAVSLLQVSEGVSLIKPLTVYGPLGIWAAAATFGMYVLFKQNQKIQETERETMIKVTELITKTLTALQVDKEIKENQRQLIFVLNEIKPHWQEFPRLKESIMRLIDSIDKNK